MINPAMPEDPVEKGVVSPADRPTGRGLWRDQAASLSRLDGIVIGLFVAIVLVAFAAPILAPHSPFEPVDRPFTAPNASLWLGTDGGGRDILSRVLFGLRNSLIGAFLVTASGILIGGSIGVIAGLLGGWVDEVLMRITDLFLAIPGTLLAIALVSAIGPSFEHLLLAIAIVWWPLYARVTRGEARALNSRPHMEAARLGDITSFRLMRRHLLPGLVPSTLVLASLDIGGLVLTLAGLSFLGLGAPAPEPELGAMAAQGIPYLFSFWWVPVGPGIGVLILAMMSNLAGDSIRDVTGMERP